MTVRYSHLAPDFLFDVAEKLVPRPAEPASGERPTSLSTPALFLARSLSRRMFSKSFSGKMLWTILGA